MPIIEMNQDQAMWPPSYYALLSESYHHLGRLKAAWVASERGRDLLLELHRSGFVVQGDQNDTMRSICHQNNMMVKEWENYEDSLAEGEEIDMAVMGPIPGESYIT
jgi:hypothetical protein